ncbi:valine--tRNA ligase [Algisphaera agarilytica]|uniref:Valine--tRNA ligase n=1 Tax=Algisphaera agarilytica TaxID=1385975 RepID=A0A7X0H6H0_9BACT|nr:valine--tRNA ligase [Algisphaera agarilytica]MBB6429937.1 valyl-tRNA synthetase [Algisphaera agarilytica]
MSNATAAHDLPSKYVPADVESSITERWIAAKAFQASAEDAGDPYAIAIPPPNVTAALHLGHALNNTLQDVLTRAARMKGHNAVWLPGTDHAGIATQSVVDKRLLATGQKALKEYKLDEAEGQGGRDAFIEKVQDWKDEYEARITQQLKDMGCSCDWDRQAFTMDEPRAKAVREAYFQLFKDGLIYRGKRLVNWDPVTQTALADDEVEMEDIDGNFYYMKYPIVRPKPEAAERSDKAPDPANPDLWEETGDFATVATTRPETMLGDTAVAVNPDDKSRAQYIGQFVKLPIVDRVIPIIGDDYVVIPVSDADAEAAEASGTPVDSKAKMASGFLKVTPAHDPNDYDIGQRHDLPIINVMAPDASISINHGWPAEENPDANDTLQPFVGLSREDARKAIVRWFKDQDLMQEVKPYRHAVGHSYRSHVPVEPYYSDQWYLKVTDDKLKGAALRAMDKSQRQPSEDEAFESKAHAEATGLKFTPERYAKTFQTWHENIRDWCISRQLWWGHRIPVWSRAQTLKVKLKPGETANAEVGKITNALLAESDSKYVRLGAAHRRVSTVLAKSGSSQIEDFVCVPASLDSAEETILVELLQERGFVQDPDVLDTWFSSALWPMSTLGWPEKTPDLELWNPTSVLCTAREIITLWVSRMVMFNLYFLDQLPFKDVFIHAMIQDGHGQKMSKSLGNGVDPIDIIHSHGSDAMRYTLTAMTTQTQDVRLPVDTIDPHTGETFTPKFITGPGGYKVAAPEQEHNGKKMVSSYGIASGTAEPTDDTPAARNTSEKFDVGQRFSTKLWNATRFALGNLAEAEPDAVGVRMSVADRWILSRTVRAVESADKHLAGYDFHNYANGLYQFVWNEVCDWYIEAVKPIITKPEGARSRQVLATVLDVSLRLLHPVMPFVTERLWEALSAVCPKRGVEGLDPNENDLLVTADWPVADRALIDLDAEQRFGRIQEVVGMIREVRNGAKVSPKETLDFSVKVGEDVAGTIREGLSLMSAMTNTNIVGVGPDTVKPENAAVVTAPVGEGYLHIEIDNDAESERLTKRKEELEKSIKTLDGRLSNEKYTSKAPAHLVQQTRDQRADAAAELERVVEQLTALG